MAARVEIIISAKNEAKPAVDQVKSDIEGIGSAASDAGSKTTGFFSNMLSSAGGFLAANVLGTIVGQVKDIAAGTISAAGDFEAGFNTFRAAAGQGVDAAGLQQFRQLFIDLGKELPVSTQEVEDAATEMVSGGIDPAIVAAGGLRQTIQFAAAAHLDLADAASTSAKLLAGWTDASASAAEKTAFLASSTDDLTKAAAASSTTVAELRLGIFNVQGAAQALHVPFADVTATLATLAPSFESSAQAGTAMNVFLTRLVPTTAPATEAMQSLGLMTTSTTKIMQFLTDQGIKPVGDDLDTLRGQFMDFAAAQGMTTKETQKLWDSFAQSKFFDAQGNFAGMANAAQLLKDKLSGLSDAQKIEALHTMFGNDAMKVANQLAIQGGDAINGMMAKMDAANGVQAQAAIMQSGYNTALENFKGSIEALQITIGSVLLPVLTMLFNNYLAPGINVLTNIASAIFGDQKAFASLDPTLQAIINALSTFIPIVLQASIGLGTFGPGLSIIQSVAAAAAPILQTLIGIFASAATQMQANGGAMQSLMAAWQAGEALISAVTAAIGAVVTAVFGQIQIFLQAHSTQIASFTNTAWTTIGQIITLAAQLIQAIIVPIFQGIAAFIQNHGAQIQQYLDVAWRFITAIIQTALDLIKGIIQVALDLVQGNWQKAWEDLKSMSETLVLNLVNIITTGLNLFKSAFDLALAAVRDLLNHFAGDAISLGGNIIDGIIKGVEHGVGALVDAVSSAAQSALDAAKAALGISSPSKLFEAQVGYNIAAGMAQGVTNGAGLVSSAAQGLAGAAYASSSSVTYGGNTVGNIYIDARGGGEDAAYNVADAVGAVLQQYASALDSRSRLGVQY